MPDPGLLSRLTRIENRLENSLEDVRLCIFELESAQADTLARDDADEPFDVLQARAVDRAKRRIAGGDTKAVLAALDQAQADRVSNLTEANIRIFLEALHD